MHGAAKVVIGLILILVGLALFADEWGFHTFPGVVKWWSSFLTVLAGVIPIVLILVGLFVVWLEWDQLKVRKAK